MSTYADIKYTDGANIRIVRHYADFREYINYNDCDKCFGNIKSCDNCYWRFKNSQSPEKQYIDTKDKIKSRCKEIENELKPLYNKCKKQIKKDYNLNLRAKKDKAFLSKMLDQSFAYTELAKEYHDLVIQYWHINLNEFNCTEIISQDGEDLSQWYKIDSRSTSAYHTQGYGARKYALGFYRLYQHITKNTDIKLKIIESQYNYELYANKNISLKDIQALNNFTLSQQCKFFWSIGINPRVYYGELPYTSEYDHT